MPEENSLRSELGLRIRGIRNSRGMTGQRLAELSMISPGYLSEVERGLSDVSSEKLVRIAEALRVTVQDLLSPQVQPSSANMTLSIPAALSEAAEDLHLSFSTTKKILQGAQSLTARRSSGLQEEWTKQAWIDFYEKVKFIFEEE